MQEMFEEACRCIREKDVAGYHRAAEALRAQGVPDHQVREYLHQEFPPHHSFGERAGVMWLNFYALVIMAIGLFGLIALLLAH